MKVKEITETMKNNDNLKLYLDYVNNTEKLEKTNASILEMKTKQVNLFSNIKETFKRDSATKTEKYDLILEYLSNNSNIIQACKKTRRYNDVNEEDYIITTEKPQLPKISKDNDTDKDAVTEVKELQDTYDKKRAKIIAEEKAYYKTIQSPPLSWKAKDETEEDVDDDILEEESSSKTKPKTKPKTPTTEDAEEEDELGDATAPKPIANPKTTAEMEKMLFGSNTDDTEGAAEEGALEASELNLDDDIEAYAPKFDEGEGYPDETDDEDEDEGDDGVAGSKERSRYKYNVAEEMTPEKKAELERDKKKDLQIPLQMISPERFDGKKSKKAPPQPKKDNKAPPQSTKGRAPSPEKIYRQLNKPVDENIKVIELDTNLSFTKNDSSKSKSKSKRKKGVK